MINPVAELRAFVRAALVEPVPRDHHETDAAFRRRRWVAGTTLVVGAAVLGWALRIEAGDSALLRRHDRPRLRLGRRVRCSPARCTSAARAPAPARTDSRAVVQSLALGVLLLAVFLAGALVVAHVPFLREPVDELLDHAQVGSLPLVAAITAVNGIAEELYFRGALYAAIGRRHAVLVTTVVYTLVTVPAGIPLLVLAAAILGLVVGLQRRVTGGILGPTITHLTWSLGMLFLLPLVLS